MNEPGFDQINLDAAPSEASITGFYHGMRPFWHPVARAAELDAGQPVSVRLLGEAIVIARLDGEVAALRDACRHFQARLSLGQIEQIGQQDCLRCPYHGWAYAANGQCVEIPQLAEGRAIPASARVARFHAKEAHGLVWVCLAETAEFALPQFPEWADDGFRAVTLDEAEPTRASAPRMILGTLDDTHFPFVHDGILGSRDATAPPDHSVERQGEELRVSYAITQPANETTADASNANSDACEVTVTYSNTVYMPGVIRLVKDSAAGRYVIWLGTCPVSYNTTRNFWAFARNYDLAPPRDATYAELSQTVRDQDKPVIESQRPILVPPMNAGVAFPMQPADAPLSEYIRWLGELNITVAPKPVA
jgi:phenylpropionate dioxygenase-like ring-hydroxylating dioxygenase large terminal subunit